MSGSGEISVLIVDDHGMVRQGVRTFLQTQRDIVVVGEAADGERATQLSAEHAPDVALVDLMMPGIGGVETTRRLKQVSPRTQVVILTSYEDDTLALNAIQAGAISFLLKDVSGEALADAVRKAARGEAVLHPKVARHLVESLHTRQRREQDPVSSLSQREHEVLVLIAEGLPNAEIAARLSIGEKTVKSHVSNILGKLHVEDRTQAAVFAWRRGLMRDE
jgi:NarL family two-component system response regulator LiaR